LEVKFRKIKSRAVAWWRHASIPARSAVAALAVLTISGVGYGAFQIVFRG
jgi:hypothetical protein